MTTPAPTPECAHANGLLLDLLYGELAGPAREELEGHVAGCARCTEDLAALRSTRKMMASLEPEAAPDAGLASLLGYAQQQAARAAPAPVPRAAWRRWIVGAVPVAAVALLGISVALESSTLHPASSLARQEQRALPEAEQGAVMVAAPEPRAPVAAPPTTPDTRRAPSGGLAAKASRDASPVLQAEATRPTGRSSALEEKSAGPSRAAAPSAPSKKLAIAVAPPAPAAKAAAPRVAESVDDMDQARASSKADREVAAKDEAESAPVAGVEGHAGRLAARAAAPPAAGQAAAPSAQSGFGAKAGVVGDLDAAGDGLDQAEQLRRAGHHAEAAEAFRQVFLALRTGSRAERALYDAALEHRAAGLLAQAVEELEQYARLFPRSSRSPTALAMAAEILRSRDGEGAATHLETDLLQRYPGSAEAESVRARSERLASPARKEKRSAAPAPAAAPAAPATAPTPAHDTAR